jgi:hypothetical protein
MFFTGTTQNERRSDQGSAKPKSHNALPQLSVSGLARKDESAVVAAFISNAKRLAHSVSTKD